MLAASFMVGQSDRLPMIMPTRGPFLLEEGETSAAICAPKAVKARFYRLTVRFRNVRKGGINNSLTTCRRHWERSSVRYMKLFSIFAPRTRPQDVAVPEKPVDLAMRVASIFGVPEHHL